MWFTRVSIQNPVFAAMMMLALLVLGAFSYQRLQVEEFPDVKFPVVVVTTTYPGASSEVVESDITRRMEEGLSSLNSLKNLYSYSYQGRSVVVTEFELTTVPEVAVQDVREKVAAVKTTFRKEVNEPLITRFNPDERPIISIALTSDRLSVRQLTAKAEQYVKKQYQTLSGVGQVNVVGGLQREIQILLKPDALRAAGVGADQVVALLKADNQELPAGNIVIRAEERQVQVRGRIQDPRDFGKLVVGKRGDAPITLSQVADVVDAEAERESISRSNGQPALTLDIVKVQGGNTIEVADRVRAATARMSKDLAAQGIQLKVLNDTSVSIRNSLNNVTENLLEGALLTVLIVFLFLGSWRSTVITGLTLPVALLGTLFFIYLAGFSINLMTLMALSLCIGLLIDDAIVVRENIVRHSAMGKSAYEAAMEGTREIGLAVFATTMSIVAVFLPVGFMGGIIGRFFFSFGLTVTAAVLLSMLVSFTLDPMLSSIWPDPDAQDHSRHRKGWVGAVLSRFDRLEDWLSERYAETVAWTLDHRGKVVALALASLVGALALAGVVGAEFVPQSDMSRLLVRFDTPEGASLDYTDAKLRQVEEALKDFPEILEVYSSVNVGGAMGKNAVNVDLRLQPRRQRARSLAQTIPVLRERVTRIAGITLKGITAPGGPAGGKPINLSIQGSDFRELQRIADQVTSRMAAIRGVVELDSSLKASRPTLDVDIDRDLASRVGLSIASISQALRPLIAGDAASVWLSPEGDSYDVKVRLASADRDSRAGLAQLPLASQSLDAGGRPQIIPLQQVATLRDSSSPSQINRRSLLREIAITASLDGRPLGEAVAEIRAITAAIDLPPGYRFDLGGASKDMVESAGYAASALLLAVIFIYMVLASQFGSLIQPLAIMSSLPLSLIGVMGALLLARSTLNMFSVIGIIMLMGLVTKNAILLVDFVIRARSAGTARTQAIIEAGRVRLRPILMTTSAMVFGMLPLAFSIGDGSESRAPMAHAIIGGVITSTLLTLLVVPVVYTLLDDAMARWRRRGART